jgi:hypothetical protein
LVALDSDEDVASAAHAVMRDHAVASIVVTRGEAKAGIDSWLSFYNQIRPPDRRA